MDLVSAWKASSIALTGAFGMLGLLTDFRNNETKKITSWGYISLSGIVLSTILGTAAQMKESSDDAKQALQVATQSSKMLNDIERSLSPPIDGLRVSLVLSADCRPPAATGTKTDYRPLCTKLMTLRKAQISFQDKDWRNIFGPQDRVRYWAAVYSSQKELSSKSPSLVFWSDDDADQQYTAVAGYMPANNSIYVNATSTNIRFGINDGTIHGLMDVKGKILLIDPAIGDYPLEMVAMILQMNTGEVMGCSTPTTASMFDREYLECTLGNAANESK